jgi:hypothetical protein
MGCSSSTIKEPENTNENKNTQRLNSITRTLSSNLTLNKEIEENIELLERCLKKPLFKEYFSKLPNLKNLSLMTNIEGVYKEIEKDFRELINNYKINFEIPEEEFDVDLGSFKLKCFPSLKEDLDFFMPLFFLEFLIYPRSFIKKMELGKLVFINSLNFATKEYEQYRPACPEYYKTMALYYCTKERSKSYIKTVLHHELFHYVDYMDNKTYEDPKFYKLNYPGFKYGRGGAYEREWKPLDPSVKGFLNFYSTTGIEEDKAEIYQHLINNPENAFKIEEKIIKSKVYYIANFLKNFDEEGMGTKDNYFFNSLIKHRKKYNY